MESVKLTISPTKKYCHQDASVKEMDMLAGFLVNDVGYHPSPFEAWALDDNLQNTNGALTHLEKKENHITLTRVNIERKNAAALTMTQEQFIRILTDWEEKVCKPQPQSVVIRYDFYNFLIEASNETELKAENEEDNPITLLPLPPHRYPFWIKMGFIICYILFLRCLLDFPYYFKLSKKIKKAHQAFQNENYADASIYFKKLSSTLPNNKYLKRYLAQSLFKSDDFEDHIIALDSLAAIELKKNEWKELLKYMPAEYIACFHDAKKG